MYGNSFFNPYMYQPYYQASNLMNGLGNINNASNFTRAASGLNNVSNFGRAAGGLGAASSGLGRAASGGGLRSLLGKFTFSDFLNGASKTLNVVNQAIPIFYQVKPIFNNAKTMFRIIGAVKEDDNPTITSTAKNTDTTSNTRKINSTSGKENTIDYQTFQEENPTFFI